MIFTENGTAGSIIILNDLHRNGTVGSIIFVLSDFQYTVPQAHHGPHIGLPRYRWRCELDVLTASMPSLRFLCAICSVHLEGVEGLFEGEGPWAQNYGVVGCKACQSRTDSHSGLHGELMTLQKAQHILDRTEPRTCEEHSQIHVHRAI